MLSFLKTHYVVISVVAIVCVYLFRKWFSISANVKSLGLWGSLAAQQRLLRWDLKSLPALIEMNKDLARMLNPKYPVKYVSADDWKRRTYLHKGLVVGVINDIKKGYGRRRQFGGSLDQFSNGGICHINKNGLYKQNWFMLMLDLGSIMIKFPSEIGIADFRRIVKDEGYNNSVRENDELERFANLANALKNYPDFEAVHERLGDEFVHMLVVFRIQYDRLRASGLIGVPDARFVAAWDGGLNFSVAIVQEKIQGVALTEMVDLRSGEFIDEYEPMRSAFRQQLKNLADSKLACYIDWNPSNFVWQSQRRCLYYVDSKPSHLAGKEGNDILFTRVRAAFIDYVELRGQLTHLSIP